MTKATKRAARRRTLYMTLAVRVPADMPAAQARREVRSLVNDQCNYDAEPGDVRVASLRSTRAPRAWTDE